MIRITLEKPKPEDLRFTISGLTLRQTSRLYWALTRYHDDGKLGADVKEEDAPLLQALWAGNNEGE